MPLGYVPWRACAGPRWGKLQRPCSPRPVSGPSLTLRWKDPHPGGGSVAGVDVRGHGSKMGGCRGGIWALGVLPVPSAAALEHPGKPGPRPADTWPAVGGR